MIIVRHQPRPVAKLREFTRPIVGRGAGLHADKVRRQRFEELQHPQIRGIGLPVDGGWTAQ